ncbi:MAG: PAS domain S-box protein [Spirochaetaceae bacterium]|nr:MAG: PAS domain S-box protein [Spirochaetaceae bacterium]
MTVAEGVAERRHTILLVEDERIIALSETAMLERHGYRIVTCATGEQAVELAINDPEIELVLMDINLGSGIDGTQAAEMILAERDLPVVFLSSHTEPEVVEKTETITSYGYIVKNTGETVLIASVKMAFRLFESRKLSEDTFRHSMNGLCVHRMLYNADGEPFDCEYLKVNEAFELHTGLSAQTVIGRTIRDLYPDEQARGVIELYAEVVSSGEPVRRELFFEPTNGWFEVSIFATRDDEFTVVVQNITARKQSEQVLAAEKEWLNVTLQSVGDAVIATDVDGHVAVMNAVAEKLTGWKAETAEGRPLCEILRIVSALTRKTCENPVEQVLRDGEVVGLANHTVLISADGTEYQIADSAAPIKGADGSIIGVVLVFRDVTEEYRVAQALSESESDMARAQSMAQLGSWRFDLGSKIVIASDQAREIYGVGDGELTIACVQSLPLPEYRSMLDEALAALVENGTPYDVEFRVRRQSDGAVRFIHSVAEYDAEHERVVGMIQDITNLKDSEQATRREHERFAMIADTSPVGITTVDEKGNITYANSAAELILGLERDKITTRTYDESAWKITDMNGEPLPDERLPFNLVKSTGRSVYDVQHSIVRSDYTRVDLSINGSPIFDDSSRFRGMVASIEDITARRRDEKRIEALVEEKDRALRESHHRVTNNMSIVHSLLSLHADTLRDDSARQALSGAASRVRSMIALYNRLYRRESHAPMSIRDFLPPLVDDIIRVVRLRVPLSADVAADDTVLPAQTLRTIGIVVNELVTNSVKHAFSEIEEPRITIKASRNGAGLTIVYQDNGPGSPNAATSDSSGVRDSARFGMQLVHAMVRQAGGTIAVETNGQMRVTIVLPETRHASAGGMNAHE